MAKVELTHAYTWTCPACEARNIEAGAPLPPDVAAEIAADLGCEPTDLESMPTRVMCSTCRRTFAVKHPAPTD